MTALIRNWSSLLAPLLASALLLSCGGGGGGGGGGGNGDAYSLSSSSVTFSATQGQATPAAQVVTVTVLRGTVFLLVTQSGIGFSQNFVITGQTTGTITITPQPPTNAGTFTGTITVQGCFNQTGPSCANVPGSPKTINVTYNVAAAPTLSATPPSVDFVTTTNVTPASKQITLTLSSGSSAWTAGAPVYTSGPANWLSVTPGNGTLSPSQTVTFDVTNTSPAGVRTATVTFTAGTLTKTVPVSLTVSDPSVNFVSPYVTTPLASHTVILRGFGFNALSTATPQVSFGGTAASAANRISDTEIRATLPGTLTANSYPITVTDGSITIPSRAGLKLLVADAPGYAATTITRTNSPLGVANLIYDREREALYLIDPDNNRIEKYTFSGGTSWPLTGTNLAGGGGGNKQIALSPDGSEILKTGGTNLVRVDPATLGTIATVPASIGGFFLETNHIAFANDGGAIGSCLSPPSGQGISLYRYDMLTQQFAALSTQFDMVNRKIVASGDGDTIAMPSFESLIPSSAKPVFILDASANTLMTMDPVKTTSSEVVAVSRSGARMIMRDLQSDNGSDFIARVFDYNGSTLTLRGSLPAGDAGFTISPDGNTAYVYYSSFGQVRKFDLTGSGSFTQTGAVAIASPGLLPARMTISPDGGTLFVAGSVNVIIVPAP